MPLPLKYMARLRWTYVYFLLIPLVNWAFSWAPMFTLWDGGTWTPFAIITGLVLVFRDFAQREIGHYVMIPLLLGTALSFLMAPAEIATASGLAFLVSELVDWGVYTFTKKPLSERIMFSSILAAPVDTAVFLYGADMAVPGIFTTWTLITAILSKFLGAFVIYLLVRRRERNAITLQRPA